MEGGGLIIRLIDVVMIILLGFLNISEFGIKAQIKLDSASSEEKPNLTVMYFVMVSPSGAFIVTNNLDDTKIMFEYSVPAANSGAPVAVKNEIPDTVKENLTKLEVYLVKKFKENTGEDKNTLVVIKSHPETKIQYAIDVLDICEKNTIPRTISY